MMPAALARELGSSAARVAREAELIAEARAEPEAGLGIEDEQDAMRAPRRAFFLALAAAALAATDLSR